MSSTVANAMQSLGITDPSSENVLLVHQVGPGLWALTETLGQVHAIVSERSRGRFSVFAVSGRQLGIFASLREARLAVEGT